MKFHEPILAQEFASRLFKHLKSHGVPEQIAWERVARYYGLDQLPVH